MLVGVVVIAAATALVVRLHVRVPPGPAPGAFEGVAALRRVKPPELQASLPRLGPTLIPYVPREGIDHAALAKHTRLALVGPSGCGKTREAAELAIRTCGNLPPRTALLLLDGPPGGALPAELPRGVEHAVLVADDVHTGWHPEAARRDDAPAALAPSPLDWLAEAIAWLTERLPGRVHVIVTAPGEQWEQMRRDSRAGALLQEFHEAWVPRLTEGESAAYLAAVCRAFGFQAPADAVATQFARAGNGTFRPVYDYIATLRRAEPRARTLSAGHVASFQRFAGGAWSEMVLGSLPREARDVMQALSALSACGAPLVREFVALLCAQLGGRTPTASYRRDREAALDLLASEYLLVQRSGRVLCHASRLDFPSEGATAAQAADVALALADVAERRPGLALVGPACGAVVRCLHARGAHRQALALSRYWLAMQPGSPNALAALALAHLNLGASRISGTDTSLSVPEIREHLRQSIECYQGAGRVWTKARRPWAWAMVQNNLGVAHMALAEEADAQHVDTAVVHFEEALSVWTAEAFAHHRQLATGNLILGRRRLSQLRGRVRAGGRDGS